jgi:hypothetical protein
VTLRGDAALDRVEQPARPLEREGYLRHEHEVDIIGRQRRVRGDEPGLAPHDLDDRNATDCADRLHVSRLHRLNRARHGRLEPKRALDEAQVVVYRLWDSHHGDAQ